MFKVGKATYLKTKLDEEKSRKFHNEMKDDFFFKETDKNHICKMCGTNLVNHENDTCDICRQIIKLSDFYVKHDTLYLVYDELVPVLNTEHQPKFYQSVLHQIFQNFDAHLVASS